MQAEVHDDFGIRTSKPPSAPPDHKLKHRGGSAVYSAVTARSVNSPRFNQSGQFTSPPCLMGDGKYHKQHSSPKFKELPALERLAKVKEHGLCFRCFGRHWQTNADVQSAVVTMAVPGYTMSCFIEPWKKISLKCPFF